jgi:phytoene/squalene synthetase
MKPRSQTPGESAALNAGILAAARLCRQKLPGIRLATSFLPANKRGAVLSLLALFGMIKQAATVPALSETLRARLEEIASGTLDLPAVEFRSEDQHALFAAVCAIERHPIPASDLFVFAEAIQSAPLRFATWPRLEDHCQKTAGIVAKTVATALGLRHSEAFAQATNLGVALELTRILIELKSDWNSGRIFIPLTDMAEQRYSERDLAAGTINPSLHQLLAFEASRAESLFRSSAAMIPWLADDGSRLFAGLVISTGLRLLELVTRQWQSALDHPPQLTTRRVIGQLARAWKLARQ